MSMCFLTDSTNDDHIESIDSLKIDLSTLRGATGNFAEANKLGEGGFGAVYKVPAIPYRFFSMLFSASTNDCLRLCRETFLMVKK